MNPIFNVKSDVKFHKELCFICQRRKKSGGKQISLALANEESIMKLKIAAEKRKNLGEINDIFDRIDNYLQNDSTIKVKWHTVLCYGPFTQEDKIQRLSVIKENTEKTKIKETPKKQTNCTLTRSKIPPFDEKLCAFCQIDCGNTKTLYSQSLMNTSNYIKKNAKLNLRLSIFLSTANDCQSKELVYHLDCYSRFRRLVDKEEKKNVVLTLLCITL